MAKRTLYSLWLCFCTFFWYNFVVCLSILPTKQDCPPWLTFTLHGLWLQFSAFSVCSSSCDIAGICEVGTPLDRYPTTGTHGVKCQETDREDCEYVFSHLGFSEDWDWTNLLNTCKEIYDRLFDSKHSKVHLDICICKVDIRPSLSKAPMGNHERKSDYKSEKNQVTSHLKLHLLAHG